MKENKCKHNWHFLDETAFKSLLIFVCDKCGCTKEVKQGCNLKEDKNEEVGK